MLSPIPIHPEEIQEVHRLENDPTVNCLYICLLINGNRVHFHSPRSLYPSVDQLLYFRIEGEHQRRAHSPEHVAQGPLVESLGSLLREDLLPAVPVILVQRVLSATLHHDPPKLVVS